MPRAQRLSQTWVRDFYAIWSEFASAKSFSWVGKWDVERGDDRGIRRLMEKENKKIRDDYRKEYNEVVKVCQSQGGADSETRSLHSTSRSKIQGVSDGSSSA